MTQSNIRIATLGLPRIGRHRELKKAVEKYWKGQLDAQTLREVGQNIRKENWLKQKEAGVDLISSNDFSFYDQVLDQACLFGLTPRKYRIRGKDDLDSSLKSYFALARGIAEEGISLPPLEMTKWFDTNYHYLVPVLKPDQDFTLEGTKIFDEFLEAKALGIQTKPVLIGPITFLKLCKTEGSFDRFKLLPSLLKVYEQIFSQLNELGCEWVQLDEPILALDLNEAERRQFPTVYHELKNSLGRLKLFFATYFGPLDSNLHIVQSLDLDVLHIDTTRAPEDCLTFASSRSSKTTLSLGIVDGRNIWKNDYEKSLTLIQKIRKHIPADSLILSPSCSLLHSPLTLEGEDKISPPEVKDWLSFTYEKLTELSDLRRLAQLPQITADAHFVANQKSLEQRRKSSLVTDPEVQARLKGISDKDFKRKVPHSERIKLQQKKLNLPLFPSTTIGSFPQTSEIRKLRSQLKSGEIDFNTYEKKLEDETLKCLRIQEEIGLDVLVHGEFERNDMVEYFGENLKGFTFTQNAWVQSYGSRCVKPPIIYGDVKRERPLTVRWSAFAQTHTQRPVKGMLTGPITLLQWSFVRDDQGRDLTAYQIAFALRDEVLDLEKAGIRVVQMDEPAFREGLPLEKRAQKAYIEAAIRAFHIASSGVEPSTQIHTHMCYCDFNDILDPIAALDADVISLESSRSDFELLKAFTDFKYPNQIGPGVWDIHSPRVPPIEECLSLLRKANQWIPSEKLWVNPDCGLKTRGWKETITSLKNMVAAARIHRKTNSSVLFEISPGN